jgi:hypothetical protein
LNIFEQAPNWIVPTDPHAQRRVNLILAWSWFFFGIFGLVDFLVWPGLGIAKSIPVLFFISVYANFTGHLSTAQAARVELNSGDG